MAEHSERGSSRTAELTTIGTRIYAGADLFYKGPYHSWYEASDPASLSAAEDHVLALASPSGLGPFDGIAGFSQGGALAASLLAKEGHGTSFKFAIFLCTGLPADRAALATSAVQEESAPGTPSTSPRPPLLPRLGGISFSEEYSPISSGPSSLGDEPSPIHYRTIQNSWQDNFGEPERLDSFPRTVAVQPRSSYLRRISLSQETPGAPNKSLIRIPTAHIMGRHDSIAARSKALCKVCEPTRRVMYEHSSGHSLPRTTLATTAIEAAIREMLKHVSESP